MYGGGPWTPPAHWFYKVLVDAGYQEVIGIELSGEKEVVGYDLPTRYRNLRLYSGLSRQQFAALTRTDPSYDTPFTSVPKNGLMFQPDHVLGTDPEFKKLFDQLNFNVSALPKVTLLLNTSFAKFLNGNLDDCQSFENTHIYVVQPDPDRLDPNMAVDGEILSVRRRRSGTTYRKAEPLADDLHRALGKNSVAYVISTHNQLDTFVNSVRSKGLEANFLVGPLGGGFWSAPLTLLPESMAAPILIDSVFFYRATGLPPPAASVASVSYIRVVKVRRSEERHLR